MSRKKTIVVVGAGISGLTAGAYILRDGHDLLVLEKTSEYGGLVNSFSHEGFLFDTGPRAVGNAGILVPMLEDLGIDLPMVKGEVSTGIKNHIVHYESNRNIDDYILSLRTLFPKAKKEIGRIERHIRSNTRMARTMNKVANPFFKNIRKDRKYLFAELLPWLPSFMATVFRTGLFNRSIEEVLGAISANQSLNDMVSQHFFKGTPAHFAFGYFENYQDYKYPLGGTAKLPNSLAHKILSDGGVIQTNTEVVKVDPAEKTITDRNGKEYSYDVLLWTANLKDLYRRVDARKLPSKLELAIRQEGQKYLSVNTGESVFSIFLAVDESPDRYRKISKGHFIYTPQLRGLGDTHRKQLDRIKADFSRISKQELHQWLKDFCFHNSYEISIPVLKDTSLAPKNRTGLIISFLVDGELFRLVEKAGWYDEFREKTTDYMIDALDGSIYPGLREKLLFVKSATPITLANRFNTENGAITGWSLEGKPPVPDSLAGVFMAVNTNIPHTYKAGQWSYSPSGVPIAILTGRIAAAAIQKDARRLA